MKGIILHGGHGTRLRPLTHTGPKQLLPIANKPMSEYGINSMKEAGVTEIAIIVGGLGSKKVKDYYGDGSQLGVRLTYVEQDEPKGIAHAINLARNFVKNENFLVFLGDNIIQKSIKEFAENFEKSSSDATLLLCKVKNPSSFGIAEIKEEKIVRIIEKPKNPPSDLAVTGIYFLNSTIFDMIDNLKPSWRNELEITDALHMLLETGHEIDYHMITDYWKDTGTPDDIIHANGIILEHMSPYFKGKNDGSNTLNGKIMVGEGTIIKNQSSLEGPIIIGKNCVIDGTSIGPHTSIGDNSTLINCTVKNSIIMSECKIEGKIKIKKSIISYSSSILSEPTNIEKTFLLGEGTKIIL